MLMGQPCSFDPPRSKKSKKIYCHYLKDEDDRVNSAMSSGASLSALLLAVRLESVQDSLYLPISVLPITLGLNILRRLDAHDWCTNFG